MRCCLMCDGGDAAGRRGERGSSASGMGSSSHGRRYGLVRAHLRQVQASRPLLQACRGLSRCVMSVLRTCVSDTLCRAETKVVYRRYASLFFVTGIASGDNELVTLEMIHRYVEVLDRYFGNVSVSTMSLGTHRRA